MDDYKNHRRHHQQQEKECEKMERYSRDLDLLHGFSVSGVTVTDDNVNKVSMMQNHYLHEKLQHEEEEEEEDKGVELNLGLSLGGRFGVDKNTKKKKLLRSSSVVGTMPLFREDDAVAFPALIRTSSLPTETEEEWRRRKEMQTLRRMEARRRRSEKQRVSREVAGAGVEQTEMGLINFGSSPVTLLPPGWGVGVPMKQVVLGDVLGKEKEKGFQGLFGHPSSQGSVDSHGGSSSLVSEMDCKAFAGASSCGGEAKSPASIQSTQERRGQDPVGSGGKTNEKLTGISKAEVENPSNKPHTSKTIIMGGQIGTNSMEDMPCVFTKGDGPNGRRIEGILYKYGKGEEVRIMCVCHGNFLSPAEFVKHAGGGDVANPLKHIVVNPSAAPF